MKKNKFTEFLKGKGYYVLLFVGVIAIAAVALIGSNLASNEKEDDQNYVDLNEPDNNIAENEDENLQADNNPASDGIVNNEPDDNDPLDSITNDNNGEEVATNDPELEDYSEVGQVDTDLAQADDTANDEVAANDEVEEPDAVETSGTTVQAETKPLKESLNFNKEDGLLWPVEGNVIMNYSMDRTIYHATLMLYKVNPAIILDAEVGTEVKAAAKGIVSSIEEDDETGLTITTDIGNGYSLVYGQLDPETLMVEEGDTVDEGEVIATIAEPSKYFIVEGSNLYFKVLENEQTVNPMTLLR